VADTQAKRQLRRNRIAEALASAVDGETIMLLELAKIWGVGKPAFVNERDRIPDFPPALIDGKTYLYPRIRALEVLDAWERRADAANAKRTDRLAALVGMELEDTAQTGYRGTPDRAGPAGRKDRHAARCRQDRRDPATQSERAGDRG
jgi:hypothetical protein